MSQTFGKVVIWAQFKLTWLHKEVELYSCNSHNTDEYQLPHNHESTLDIGKVMDRPQNEIQFNASQKR